MKAGKGDGWIESKSYCLLRRLFQRATNHKLKSKPKSSHPILSFMQIPPSYYYPFNLGYLIHRIIVTSEVASIIHILHCHRRSPPIRRSSIEVAKIAGSKIAYGRYFLAKNGGKPSIHPSLRPPSARPGHRSIHDDIHPSSTDPHYPP
jgi:hypothetical protein